MYSGKDQYNMPTQTVVADYLTRKDSISEKKPHGDKLVRYFILYVVTVLIRRNAQSGVRAPILKSIAKAENVKKYNWCGYVLNQLNQSVKEYNKKKANKGPDSQRLQFDGPMLFLMVIIF